MSKILMVDDEQHLEILIRQKFRKEIKSGEYEFIFAHNGQEALEKINQDNQISLVISDINMPEMDGLTLLNHLDKTKPGLKVIIASAYNDIDNVKSAMEKGAYDFITKPLDLNELRETLKRITTQQGLSREEITSLKKESLPIETEMAAASKLQLSILPSHFLDQKDVQIYATTRAALEVGGDFYDYFWVSPSKLAVLVADVSGKGFAAALFMSMAKTMIKLMAMEALTPKNCLLKVNQKLLEDNKTAMFVTIFYGVLDVPTGQFTYANGGHYPPYLIDQQGCHRLFLPAGMALGVGQNPIYGEERVLLHPKSTLFLYTDGITDAFNKNGVEFTDQRLRDSLIRHGNEPLKDLVENITVDVKNFVTPHSQSDDLTCLALRYTAND